MKNIVIIGTLDTKEELILFTKNQVENLGYKAIIIDTSTRIHSSSAADITCDETAQAAGTTIDQIRNMKKRNDITALMIDGAIKKAQALLSEGKLDGIMALGGAGAATVGTAVMKALPFGDSESYGLRSCLYALCWELVWYRGHHDDEYHC